MQKKDGVGKLILLGVQHAFAMFCATILVPILTGLDPAVALLAAGIGTLIFHLCTGGKVPVFLGSSFAFIPALVAVIGTDASQYGSTIPKAMGGIICAGAVYLVVALLIKFFGPRFIDRLFPPVVRGVGIAIIGLCLSTSAIGNIQFSEYAANVPVTNFDLGMHWIIAAVVLIIAVVITSYAKGLLKLSGIIIALATGYVLSLILVLTGVANPMLMNLDVFSTAPWFSLPKFSFPPVFDLHSIALITPIALVSAVEHVGDIYANGSVVGKNFTKDPGLHRTMLGDGLATRQYHLFGKHRRARHHGQLQSGYPAHRRCGRHSDELLRQVYRPD